MRQRFQHLGFPFKELKLFPACEFGSEAFTSPSGHSKLECSQHFSGHIAEACNNRTIVQCCVPVIDFKLSALMATSFPSFVRAYNPEFAAHNGLVGSAPCATSAAWILQVP